MAIVSSSAGTQMRLLPPFAECMALIKGDMQLLKGTSFTCLLICQLFGAAVSATSSIVKLAASGGMGSCRFRGGGDGIIIYQENALLVKRRGGTYQNSAWMRWVPLC